MTPDQEGLDRRRFLKGIATLVASTAVNSLPSNLIESAAAQERTVEKPYEKQEPKIPSAEEIDQYVRSLVQNKDRQGSTVDLIESKVFGGGDPLSGIKAFETVNEGIAWNVNILRGRAQLYKQDIRPIEDLYNKALAIKTTADDAYVSFLGEIPDYVMLAGSINTVSSANTLRTHALTLARANDALVPLRDEIQKITGR